jgi:hypothetical protein
MERSIRRWIRDEDAIPRRPRHSVYHADAVSSLGVGVSRWGTNAGLSLPVIGALLGHSQVQTTQRYAHLFEHPLRAATEKAAAAIVTAGTAAAPVTALRPRRYCGG